MSNNRADTTTSREFGARGRGDHPFVDAFDNDWAWAFEDLAVTSAAQASDHEDMVNRWALGWEMFGEHKPEMAEAWVAFLGRFVARLVLANPEQLRLAVAAVGGAA